MADLKKVCQAVDGKTALAALGGFFTDRLLDYGF